MYRHWSHCEVCILKGVKVTETDDGLALQSLPIFGGLDLRPTAHRVESLETSQT
jgi:hypothetical protein